MIFQHFPSLLYKGLPIVLLISITLTLIQWYNGSKKIPPPTEIIERKKDRKIFKQNRKDWMENMHRSAPNIDWRKIDQESREQQVLSKTSVRKGILNKIHEIFII